MSSDAHFIYCTSERHKAAQRERGQQTSGALKTQGCSLQHQGWPISGLNLFPNSSTPSKMAGLRNCPIFKGRHCAHLFKTDKPRWRASHRIRAQAGQAVTGKCLPAGAKPKTNTVCWTAVPFVRTNRMLWAPKNISSSPFPCLVAKTAKRKNKELNSAGRIQKLRAGLVFARRRCPGLILFFARSSWKRWSSVER